MAADTLETLKAALADRYAVERELGRGGNAVVYLARDLKHDRKVALKVLLPELALAVRTERFFREIQIAAKLSHPHILTLIDSGQAGEFLYYVMPYVEGESLRDRITREKQLPVEDALQITREVAEALGYAHKQGVVHRDIKPENILLHGGHAVVMDFGIARALTAAGSGTITEAGIAVGTPAYMSPEQGAGSGEPDARSDIYSLGCVLYEMLAGHPPFTGATAQEIMSRHVLDAIPTIRAARPQVPAGVERAVERSLAKAPADRFSTATQFREALVASVDHAWRRPQLAYLALTGLLLFGSAWAVRHWFNAGSTTRPSEQSVAVLPCVNISTDPDNEPFTDGVTEALIDELSQVEGLRVPARTSAFVFKGKPVDIGEAGRKLNVAYVVECSVRRAGGLLRVTAQLIKVSDGYHQWSQQYESQVKTPRDVFAIQDSVSSAIVKALAPRLTVTPPSTRRYSHDPEAYEMYLKGRYFSKQGAPDSRLKAIDYFLAALARDSTYALAWSGLADAYLGAAIGMNAVLPREEVYSKARRAALKATALDETLAEAHVAMGKVYYILDHDPGNAEREFSEAIRLNPGLALAHGAYGTWLSRVGRFDQAIQEYREGQRLDPISPDAIQNLANGLYYGRRYDEALVQLAKLAEVEPTSRAGTIRLRARIHCALDAPEAIKAAGATKAIADLQELIRGSGGVLSDFALLVRCNVAAGRRGDARKILSGILGRPRTADVWNGLAFMYVDLGENEKAIDALEKAYAGGTDLLALKANPPWDPIRHYPRFMRLVEQLGLNP